MSATPRSHRSVTIRWTDMDLGRPVHRDPAPLSIRAEKTRLPVGSQLNGLDEILAGARRRSRLSQTTS